MCRFYLEYEENTIYLHNLSNNVQIMDNTFIGQIEGTLKQNWDLDALTDYNGSTLQYKDVARKIEKMHILMAEGGVEKGDKIAICGRNSSHWGVAFLATVTYGAVAVPILHEFTPEVVHNIVNHSDAKFMFVGDAVWPTLDAEQMPALQGIILVNDFSLLVSRSEKLTYAREHLNEMFGKKYPKNFRIEHIHYEHESSPDQLAIINYTSGSTGLSKGVMLPFRSLLSNVEFAKEVINLKPGSSVVSMLPMAHMYGMAFEFLYEFCQGLHIYFLTRVPSPKIIFQAFADVKPHIVIAVPLIIEKIIKKAVLPKLQTPTMKILLKVPIINDKIKASVRQKVIEAFGGRFYEVIVGGAAFNQDVEKFLRMIDFPYTVGYGMTECGPIICYEDWKRFKMASCGKAAPRMEVKVLSPDPENIVGEIVCRGANVMLGYYKNEEATREAIDAEGWLHTGDLGVIDAEGNITIKGHSKNMLLSASGQNIYPEEIEDKLNNLHLVSESIIIQKGDKLVALIHPDYDEAGEMPEEELKQVMQTNVQELNTMIPHYSQISRFVIMKDEFEKTPKKSIKRFLYQNAAD